jgi:hypothetical protein
MDFKQKILESCTGIPAMGKAIVAAYECIFEAYDAGTVQNTGTTGTQAAGVSGDKVAIDVSALTENPESAEVLANLATKAKAEKDKVDQAQAALDETNKAAAQAIADLNAKKELGEETQNQIPSA